MILHKNLLLWIAILLGTSLHAQYKIKGKILDENKLPIAQALVKSDPYRREGGLPPFPLR